MPRVTFLADARTAAGRAMLVIEADSVASLLSSLGRAVGQAFAGLLWDGESLRTDVEVLVNGRNVDFLAGLDTQLVSTDEVTIFFSGVRGFPGG